jgi:hypothetical protein
MLYEMEIYKWYIKIPIIIIYNKIFIHYSQCSKQLQIQSPTGTNYNNIIIPSNILILGLYYQILKETINLHPFSKMILF